MNKRHTFWVEDSMWSAMKEEARKEDRNISNWLRRVIILELISKNNNIKNRYAIKGEKNENA